MYLYYCHKGRRKVITSYGYRSGFTDIVSVLNHVEWWAKNKRMYRIPTRGLFLTYTKESIFIKYTQIQVLRYFWQMSIYGIKPLLGMLAPCPWLPILAGPLLKANCPIAAPSPSVPYAHSTQHNFYLHSDNINMPASSWWGTVSASYSYCSDQWMHALPCNMHMYKLLVHIWENSGWN